MMPRSHPELWRRLRLDDTFNRWTFQFLPRSNFMKQTPQSTYPSPAVLFIVAVVVGQAIALTVNAILTIVDPDSQELPPSATIFLMFLFVLGAVWLLAAARGVYLGKAWPRGALVVAEVLAVIVSFTYLQLGDVLVGLALLISGGVVLVTLFTPALNTHLVQRRNQTNT